IDYFKRPKALYFYTRRFFNKLLPLAKNKDGDIVISVINDGDYVNKINLEFELWSVSGELLMNKTYTDLKIPDDSVMIIDRIHVEEDILSKSVGYIAVKKDDDVIENHEIFADLRINKLDNPHITYKVEGRNLILKTQKPAIGVNVRVDGENY